MSGVSPVGAWARALVAAAIARVFAPPSRECGVAGDTRAPAAGGVGIEEALRWVQAYTPDPYQVVDPALTPSRVRRPLWPDDELRAAETRPGARTDERSDP